MKSLLDRDLVKGNILDVIREYRERLEILERLVWESGGGEGGQAVAEGPDIDLVYSGGTAVIGRGGDTILMFDSGGNPLAEYAATAAGLIASLAAMSAGDKFEIPQVKITLTANLTIPAGVMGWGMSRTGTIIDVAGYTITMGNGAYLANMRIETEEDTSSDLIAVKNSVTGESMLEMIDIYVSNAGAGDGIGVSAENALARGEGMIIIKDCYLYANSDGGAGYAGVSSAGVIEVYHSRVYGSTDRFITL